MHCRRDHCSTVARPPFEAYLHSLPISTFENVRQHAGFWAVIFDATTAVGFAVGLFAPPLLAATAVGAAMGAGAGKLLHRRTASKIEEQAGATIRSAAPASSSSTRDRRPTRSNLP